MTIQLGISQTEAHQSSLTDAAKKQIRKTADEFEAFFLSQVVEVMQAGIKTDGPFGGGNGEKVFRSMLSQEYSQAAVRSGGIGIADAVYQEMLKLQEGKTS